MSESGQSVVTRVLQAVEAGDPKAAERLLPIVYAELRKLGRCHFYKSVYQRFYEAVQGGS
jgi:hypothetical protein